MVRSSDHAYVRLNEPEVKSVIEGWVNAEGHLEPGVREQVKGWLADLQDWCITRDAPYFGFPVHDPDFPGKFLYVWVDAPIGYLSSAERYFAVEAPEAERLSPAAYEARYLAEGAPSRLEHFIGKDILRFHAVFWPAMLWAAGLKRPDRMAVHGHLIVNGEKMSKSRGTFISGRDYLDSGLDPELLRYFYASNLQPGIYDIDLALEEFRNRVNADLAKRIGNLASRVHALVAKGPQPLVRPEVAGGVDLRGETSRTLAAARIAFRDLEFRTALRTANELADLGNKALQDAKPWESLESDASRALLFDLSKALHALAVVLGPVMPRFAAGLAEALGWREPGLARGASPPSTGSPCASPASRRRWRRWTRSRSGSSSRRLQEKACPLPRWRRAPVARGSPHRCRTTQRGQRCRTRRCRTRLPAAPRRPRPAPRLRRQQAARRSPGLAGVRGHQYDDFARVELRVAPGTRRRTGSQGRQAPQAHRGPGRARSADHRRRRGAGLPRAGGAGGYANRGGGQPGAAAAAGHHLTGNAARGGRAACPEARHGGRGHRRRHTGEVR